MGEHEFCGDFLLGMDKNKRYILFYKNVLNSDPIVKIVDLSTIFSCKVLKETKTIKTTRESMEYIERIDLSFISRDKKETRLELFSEERNTQLNGELQCAEKWEQVLTELIYR
jgi:G:T/U-mismatch repair DNA glycosylase